MAGSENLDNPQPSPPIASQVVQAQLDRILSSDVFAGSPRLQEFLRYVVDETLAGRAARIKGLTIAHDVFQRDNLEDPQESTIVRVEAGRLRRCLDDYYQTEGQRDLVRIEIPKGTYVPSFEANSPGDQEPTPPGEVEQVEISATPAATDFRKSLIGDSWGKIAILVVAVAALGLTWSLYTTNTGPQDRASEPPAATAVLADKPVIAVLPFQDMTGAKILDSLAEGLTEDVISSLSNQTYSNVIALSSMKTFKGKTVDPQLVGRDLKASHIVQGSIRGEPSKLRITAQLVDAQNGIVVWSARFDRDFDDELTMQDQLAREIAEGVLAIFAGQADAVIRRWQDTDQESFVLYKQALNLITPQSDPGRNRLSRQAFERLIERDPNFAGGYAGAAYTHAFAAFFGHSVSPDDDARKAIELAEKAISLDDSLGLAYTSKAYAYLVSREFDAALAASTNSITLQPNAPRSVALHALLLVYNGEAARGVGFAKRALLLDPLAVRTPYLNILAIAYFHSGEYKDALQTQLRHFERGSADSPMARGYLVATYAALGRRDEARAAVEILNRRHPEFDFESWIRRNFRQERDIEEVMRPIRDLGID